AGLPATAVAWGHWAVPGGPGAGTSRPGVHDLPPATALAALRRALDHDETTVTVCDVDWATLAGPVVPPLLADLPEATAGRHDAGQEQEGPDALLRRLAEADAPGRRRVLRQLVLDQTAEVLRHADSTAVDPRRGFREQGFDSLAAVQFRNRICAATGLTLPVTAAFDHPSPGALADHLLSALTPESGTGPGDAADDLEQATDDEIVALLASEFGIT
ncbi:acyl carrier protein, partial [Streptomyces bohaiensis]